MSLGIYKVPAPANEIARSYLPGSAEKITLKAELERQKITPVEIPLIIGGKEVKTGNIVEIKAPHDLSITLGTFHQAGEAEINQAIDCALEARKSWSQTPMEDRAAVFLKAADLLTGPFRDVLNAATMLGQSKNVWQSEIEAVCELADFWRFNTAFMMEVYQEQPPISPPGMWNRSTYRPLEGFIFAVTPFNFTAIGGNLPTAPAMMGNVSLWKPSSTAVLSNYYLMQILKEAGLPDGVVNFIPGKGRTIGDPVLSSPHFSGIHFTGSTSTFNSMWKTIGENLSKSVYKTYPRIVGETGGKDFVFAHPDTEAKALAVALIRGAYEYQGQKCSAASRAYVPESIWPAVLSHMKEMIAEIQVGDVCDFRTFMGAVIDKSSFENIVSYIEYAKKADDAKIVAGGEYDGSKGYFIRPTVIQTSNPHFKSMEEEIFGPVLTVYVYADDQIDETLDLVDNTSPYALTGSIFGKDRGFINMASQRLENAAGNFYINDKPTAAVVGQQPFGGARASGTNDKAGSILNLLRWVSARSIKETFVPPTDYRYPHMDEE
jgi:1-pyrroline-5-carboxylate dehydrogenase